MWFTGYCAGSGWAGLLLMVGLWAGLLAVVFWGVRRMFPASRRHGDPLDLLATRLASGDIDPDEFRRRQDQIADAGRR